MFYVLKIIETFALAKLVSVKAFMLSCMFFFICKNFWSGRRGGLWTTDWNLGTVDSRDSLQNFWIFARFWGHYSDDRLRSAPIEMFANILIKVITEFCPAVFKLTGRRDFIELWHSLVRRTRTFYHFYTFFKCEYSESKFGWRSTGFWTIVFYNGFRSGVINVSVPHPCRSVSSKSSAVSRLRSSQWFVSLPLPTPSHHIAAFCQVKNFCWLPRAGWDLNLLCVCIMLSCAQSWYCMWQFVQ